VFEKIIIRELNADKVDLNMRKKIILLFGITIIASHNVYLFAQKLENISKNEAIDYSNLKNWAAHPWKIDPSDSIPDPLKQTYYKDSLVDVFFIHPTSYTDKNFTSWNAQLNDEIVNKKTDEGSILYQASVFNETNRVFAPRYRQAHYNAFFINKEDAKVYFDIAYEDVKNSFLYYLENYNNGRPIIIAGHSQGTLHAGRLLKEFFEGKILQNKLVCAYLIGMPVPENYFTTISPCQDSSATGCFVSWRTFKSGYEPDFVKKENFKSVVTNPLSWKTNENYISKKYNEGGVLKKFNKVVPRVVDAQVKGNVLWSCKPDILGKIFLMEKNFHIGDFNLFYLNIRNNVRHRINCFWKK
jgi:hypothetical protein